MTESPQDPAQDPVVDQPGVQPRAEPEVEADVVPEAGPDVGPASGPAAGPDGEAGSDVPSTDPAQDEVTVARMELEERTLDLQRLQAEFLNYKRRVDRDRELVKENATFSALAPITDVLDNIDRAREHGPLDEGFRAVAEQLERVVAGQGLVRYGAPGDAFDPTIHDALSHLGEDAEVEVTTVKVVAKGGYKIGERVVRAAQVLVVDPVTAPA